jgi:dTDP-4-amino-4,6-dideoxygalactose transaminase
MSSGTAALFCALKALGIGKGDGVMIPVYVCTALLHAVNASGASPVLADVDPVSGNITALTARKAMRRTVRAVIVPHMFGFPAPAREIGLQLGVPVIEDCAQCVGGSIDGRRVGALTAVSVFSFYATKMLAAGEGGLAATSDSRIARRMRDIIEYDKREDFRPRFNFRMSDMTAAVARVQLSRIETVIKRRRAIAALYTRELGDMPGVRVPRPSCAETDPVYFRYIIRTGMRPDLVISTMSRKAVACSRPVYKPLHRYLGQKGFPGADSLFRTAVSLPIYPGLSQSDAKRVIQALCATMAEVKKD